MSDKTNSPPSSHSSSAPLQPDPSLERLLGAIAKALDGLVAGNFELRQAFADLRKIVAQSSTRTEGRIAELQVAVDTFVLRIEAVVEHQKTVTGSTVDARRALEKSQESFDKAVKDVTGTFSLTRPEEAHGEAPLVVRRFVVRATNFFWPLVIKKAPVAAKALYVASWAAMAALLKIIYPLVVQIAQVFR